ncbi:IS66 family transposase [Psychrobacter sanguinis]|uniref:IS66 family transposase n=2 Tax=Psychrobacter sanguinis TaxID=861445 RepID=UPI001D14FB63|nr:IS66 family transposase [Psychrobacter sanguinis]MCC3306995.1 IS66 family transposase [Psychrobacter sanguinis]MCC3307330.1 IS66 family transposase [Psychrobacter sanguinis]MCC3307573.1 IS66 family transposase [Psychrobacter sanguinis]MCC3307676.1 IS66 family transposase [Psychrobacter sanguinis]MCC3309225.1 IS66 family transposase [Psychrobacter sanguinis]
MTVANLSDLSKDPIYAELLVKIHLLEQRNEHLQQQLVQTNTSHDQLQQLFNQVVEENHKLYEQVLELIEKQKRLIHRLYGQKSEGITDRQTHLNYEAAQEDLAQLEQIRDDYRSGLSKEELAKLPAIDRTEAETLIDEAELKAAKENTDELPASATDQPKKTKRAKYTVIPDNLEVKTQVHEPLTTVCDCGCQMKRIGEDKQDKLGIIPQQFYIERHIYPKWVCRECDIIHQAAAPKQIINKSIATPELLAHILISKYADHQPLYRQNIIYQRSGVNIPDATMADWVGRCGVALEPLVSRLHELLLSEPILHADETPVSIMKNHVKVGSKSLKKGYVWAYLTPQQSSLKAVVYDFAESRRNEHPKAFLDKWRGKLVCDDYSGYKFLFHQGVTEIGCLAHARRKFHELHITGQSIVSIEALTLFRQLYAIEREIDERFEKNTPPIPRDPQVVRQIRQEKAKPIADKLHQWLQEKRQLTTKNASISKAMDYCLKRWQALTQYLDDGRLPIDNNWAENQMRPWALGRKNWLFAGSLRSGQRAANIMSIIQSARLNGLDVSAYLTDVLRRLPTQEDLDELLPHRWVPPQ